MAIGGALAGCVTVGDPKHQHPVPAKLVAAMQSKGMAVTDPILIRMFKKRMSLRTGSNRAGEYARLKTFCRGSGQLGPKTEEGDRQTPKGFYTVRGPDEPELRLLSLIRSRLPKRTGPGLGPVGPKSPLSVLSSYCSVSISHEVRNPRRGRIGRGGHQPCTACWNRKAMTTVGTIRARTSCTYIR